MKFSSAASNYATRKKDFPLHSPDLSFLPALLTVYADKLQRVFCLFYKISEVEAYSHFYFACW